MPVPQLANHNSNSGYLFRCIYKPDTSIVVPLVKRRRHYRPTAIKRAVHHLFSHHESALQRPVESFAGIGPSLSPLSRLDAVFAAFP
jgi:hypothetical protein